MVVSDKCSTQGEETQVREEETVIDSITVEDRLTENMELSRWVYKNHCTFFVMLSPYKRLIFLNFW